jgi:hypothetical protein
MASVIVKFRFTGLSPLLTNNPAKMGGGRENGVAVKRIPMPEVEAKQGLYVNAEGNYFIRADAFRSAVIGKGGSASGRRIGKRSAISCVSAGFFLLKEEAILVHPKTKKRLDKYEIDARRVVVQGNGVTRCRPKFPEWSCEIVAEIDTDFVSLPQLTELLKIAGKVSGVGDYRPQRKGSFGRFTVEMIEE